MGKVVSMEVAKVRARLKHSDAIEHTVVRPYQTAYFGSVNDKASDYSKIGRAKTPAGAVRAAFWRLLIGQYTMAVVHGLDGEVMFRLTRKGRTIEVFGWFDKFTFLES